MSTAVGSGKQQNLFSEDTEALYDPYFGFAVNNVCAEIPWPEWNDAELNAEVWDEGKGGRAPTVAGLKNASLMVTGSAFEDSNPPALPPPVSDHVRAWRRPQEVFPGAALTVYEPTNAEFELHVPSTLSLGWNFFKVFIEQITVLQFYAVKYGFHVEGETGNFVASTQGETWRPWHHVYAMCKAGKGQVHKPSHCPFGKYVLRLFYMGGWRRFVVDDKIPCDDEGNCMLPVTQVCGELWPIILTKGLIKILSLTPADDFSATDFPLVSALTGWTHGHFAAENKTAEQIWRRLKALIPRYEQSEKTADAVHSVGKNPPAKMDSSRRDSRKSVDRDESKTERFCVLFGDLSGFSYEEEISVDCTVAIIMTRDCPIVKAARREGTKPWKRFRWIYWAKEKGLWSDESELPPYRRLQIITFLPELSDLLLPDPKQEAALYDIPLEEDSSVEDELSTEGSKLFEPEQWSDYFRLLDYLTRVNVFFKPSHLVYNFKVTCLKERVAESTVGKGTSKAPPSLPQNVLIFPTVLRQTGNEPVYLLSESITGIFLCISLWVSPQESKTRLGYLDSDQPTLLKVGRGSLVIEQCDWRFISQGKILGVVKTVGCSSVVLNLKPGRHILKLWHSSDSPYVVDIYSNANVVVSKSPKLRFLMNAESQQILQYINNVSNSFIALTSKFGKPDLASALRDFYDTIQPKNDSIPHYHRKLNDFIENFLNCIMLTLKDLIPNADELTVMMWALRSLFVNPNIQCDLPSGGTSPSVFGGSGAKKAPKKAAPLAKERSLSEILSCVTLPEEIDKIVSVQKVFRGYRVRLLWKYQTAGRKEFKPFAERLKKICDAVFSPPKRELEVGKLLRRIVTINPDLLSTFRFCSDFPNVLQVEEYSGKIPNVEPFAWVPIARFVIACHCEGLVSCGFYLSCNLEQSVIQGFDNDVGEEIFRLTNAVSPHYYQSNVKGYTILVFGWNEASVKTVNWRLEMVKMKHFHSMHLCNLLMSPTCQPYLMPGLDVFEVRNFYIPNSRSRIFRCLIKIQKRTLLTLRLSLSYSEVQFVVVISLAGRFYDSDSEDEPPDQIIAEVSSRSGAVIMPSLVLEHVEIVTYGESVPESNPTVYVVEAYVLNDSWPLTKQEWGLVEPIRVNGESWKDSATSFQSKRGGGSESRRKLQRASRRSMSEQKIENPFWLLQVLNDSTGPESAEGTVIEEDKSYAESVRAMKLYWEERDPGRRKRGREFRMNFLYAMYLEERKNGLYYGEDYGEESFEKNGEVYEDPQFVVDRLSSFSYLTNDQGPTRYIHSPRILPVVPLEELLCKYRKVTEGGSVSDEAASKYTQSLEYSTEISFRLVDDLVADMEDERKDFLSQCTYYRSVMAIHMSDVQKLSTRLMEQAYDARHKFIERKMR